MSYRSTPMFLVPFFVAGVLAAQERPQENRERPPPPPPARARETPPPARPAPERPASPENGGRSVEERRAVAQDAARFEANYRRAVARIDRLISVYQSNGNQEKVMQLERMLERLAVRREHALEGFRRDLGEEGFRRVQGQLDGGGRRALQERTRKTTPPGETGGGR